MSSSPIVIGLAVTADQRDPNHWISLAKAAESAGISLLIIDEPRAAAGARARLDAALIASLLATRTTSLALVPAFRVTHSEPFHISKAVATVDHVSKFTGPARAGWLVDVETDEAAAAAVGRRTAPDEASAWAEAAEAADVVQRLWDSWEDDAEIRDRATGRFIDREKLHYIDFTGEHFSVRGPSITPRPPQGQPVTFVRSQPGSEPAHDFADVVLVPGGTAEAVDLGGPVTAGAVVLPEIDIAPADNPSTLLAELDRAEHGLVLRTASPLATLEVIGPVLRQWAATGRLADPEQTLRARLGLGRPTNRYADERAENQEVLA